MELKDMTKEEKLEYFKKLKEARKKEEEREEKQRWENLKPVDIQDGNVPELPRNLTQYHIDRLLDCGVIRKKDLKDGLWYYGDYRNAKLGQWDIRKEKFRHLRYKWGHFQWDECNHFQDDNGFALFVPIRLATPEEIKGVLDKI
jgi:hypothetical protein